MRTRKFLLSTQRENHNTQVSTHDLRNDFEITSQITPELYDTKSYYQLRIKVTGPVSLIHFSFPVEAGQLT